MTATALALLLLVLGHVMAQGDFKKNLATTKQAKPAQCCDDVRSLKVQVANLSSMLEEMNKKQESDLMKVVRQMMDMEKLNQQQEARVTEAESKYSEIYNRIEIMQMQAAQSAPQQSTSGESWHRKLNICLEDFFQAHTMCYSTLCRVTGHICWLFAYLRVSVIVL